MYISAPSEHAQVYAPLSSRDVSGAAPVTTSPVDDRNSPDVTGTFSGLVVSFDYRAGISVLEFRDSATGKVTDQVPSKKAVQEYIRHGAVTAAAPASQATPADTPPQTTGETPPTPVATPTPAAPATAPADTTIARTR